MSKPYYVGIHGTPESDLRNSGIISHGVFQTGPMGGEDGTELVRSALRTLEQYPYSDNVNYVRKFCRLLEAITVPSNDVRCQDVVIWSDDLVSATTTGVCKAMAKYPNDVNLQMYGFGVFENLLNEPQIISPLQVVLIDKNAIDAVFSAMEAHPKEMELQDQAITLLSSLLVESTDASVQKAVFVEKRGASLLAKAEHTFRGCDNADGKNIAQAAREALEKLISTKAFCSN